MTSLRRLRRRRRFSEGVKPSRVKAEQRKEATKKAAKKKSRAKFAAIGKKKNGSKFKEEDA